MGGGGGGGEGSRIAWGHVTACMNYFECWCGRLIGFHAVSSTLSLFRINQQQQHILQQ